MFQVVWKVVWGIGKLGLRVYDLLLSEILEISGATQNPSFVVSDAPPPQGHRMGFLGVFEEQKPG